MVSSFSWQYLTQKEESTVLENGTNLTMQSFSGSSLDMVTGEGVGGEDGEACVEADERDAMVVQPSMRQNESSSSHTAQNTNQNG